MYLFNLRVGCALLTCCVGSVEGREQQEQESLLSFQHTGCGLRVRSWNPGKLLHLLDTWPPHGWYCGTASVCLGLRMLLSQPPKCWDDRYAAPCPALKTTFTSLQVSLQTSISVPALEKSVVVTSSHPLCLCQV